MWLTIHIFISDILLLAILLILSVDIYVVHIPEFIYLCFNKYRYSLTLHKFVDIILGSIIFRAKLSIVSTGLFLIGVPLSIIDILLLLFIFTKYIYVFGWLYLNNVYKYSPSFNILDRNKIYLINLNIFYYKIVYILLTIIVIIIPFGFIVGSNIGIALPLFSYLMDNADDYILNMNPVGCGNYGYNSGGYNGGSDGSGNNNSPRDFWSIISPSSSQNSSGNNNLPQSSIPLRILTCKVELRK